MDRQQIKSAFSTEWLWSSRNGTNEISDRMFNLVIAQTTIYGLVVYVYMVWLMRQLPGVASINKWTLLALVLSLFVGSIVGFVVASNADPLKAYLGLFIGAACLGALTGPVLFSYKGTSVAAGGFGIVTFTLILGTAGALYPKSLERWGPLLCTALSGLLSIQVVLLLLPQHLIGRTAHNSFTITGWLGVVLFSGYIVYDFNRAQFVTKTYGNAVQVGVAIFLDVINLFIRLLRLFGSKKNDED